MKLLNKYYSVLSQIANEFLKAIFEEILAQGEWDELVKFNKHCLDIELIPTELLLMDDKTIKEAYYSEIYTFYSLNKRIMNMEKVIVKFNIDINKISQTINQHFDDINPLQHYLKLKEYDSLRIIADTTHIIKSNNLWENLSYWVRIAESVDQSLNSLEKFNVGKDLIEIIANVVYKFRFFKNIKRL